MKKQGVARPPNVPFFFLFGTIGGWLLAFAFSPSGMAASYIIVLVTAAPLAVLISSIYLTAKEEKTIYHRVAQWAGFAYPALLGVWAVTLLGFFKDY